MTVKIHDDAEFVVECSQGLNINFHKFCIGMYIVCVYIGI